MFRWMDGVLGDQSVCPFVVCGLNVVPKGRKIHSGPAFRSSSADLLRGTHQRYARSQHCPAGQRRTRACAQEAAPNVTQQTPHSRSRRAHRPDACHRYCRSALPQRRRRCDLAFCPNPVARPRTESLHLPTANCTAARGRNEHCRNPVRNCKPSLRPSNRLSIRALAIPALTARPGDGDSHFSRCRAPHCRDETGWVVLFLMEAGGIRHFRAFHGDTVPNYSNRVSFRWITCGVSGRI
jgi:hypothetical protein